ncbi:Conjugative transposon protein TcpC [Pilibacter termitis]|uniref:Conjugative transposon protein TcpC n=1 Tax=Pilibacter termitis TaxID=263852 RepID=A0A1T4NET7_9ENTE|nr:conjugal transfer protein [Pilibacter termitis]SJZ77779.1 Conjugative transposon protein TcpC [Pilibacter termitis]
MGILLKEPERKDKKRLSKKKRIVKKEKAKKSPQAKEVSAKKARRVVSVFFLLLLAFSILAVLHSNILVTQVQGVYQDVKEIKQKQKISKVQGGSSVDLMSLQDYTKQFLQVYYNVNTMNGEDKERNENLSSFLSFETKDLEEKLEKITRQLLSFEMVEVKEVDGLCLTTYRVNCEVSTQKETEKLVMVKEGNKTVKKPQRVKELIKSERVEEIVLPVKISSGGYTIYSLPYTKAVSFAKANVKQTALKFDSVELSAKQKEKLMQFLGVFFTKYASASKEELTFMMKHVELTAGNEVPQAISEDNVQVFETKQATLGVLVSVVFQNNNTGETHKEHFTLFLNETKNSFEVQNLKHYFSVNEN